MPVVTDVAAAKMDFGKHLGRPVTVVASDYLMWCHENMSRCPLYVVGELKRRGLVSNHKKQESEKFLTGKSAQVTGALYREARAKWEAAGGDPSSCPFDDPEQEAFDHLRAIMLGG